MNLTGEQKRTILAAYLGRTLDAFDFFVLTFVIKDIAKEFGVEVSSVAYAKGRKPTPAPLRAPESGDARQTVSA